MCRCGTSGYVLVGVVLLGWWLDLMIFEVFSNLWFYDLIALHTNTSEFPWLHVYVTLLHWLFLGGWFLATNTMFRAVVLPVLSSAAGPSASTWKKCWGCKTKCSGVEDHQHEGFWLITCCQATFFFPAGCFILASVTKEATACRTSAFPPAEVGNTVLRMVL